MYMCTEHAEQDTKKEKYTRTQKEKLVLYPVAVRQTCIHTHMLTHTRVYIHKHTHIRSHAHTYTHIQYARHHHMYAHAYT